MQFALDVAVLECPFLKHSQEILEVKKEHSHNVLMINLKFKIL
jgi:hypothetical protein